MKVRATLAVRAERQGGRPSRRALEDATSLLESAGFTILRIGRFAISVEGEPLQFEDTLGVLPEPGRPLVAVVEPNDEGLRRLVGRVEIAPAPKFLA